MDRVFLYGAGTVIKDIIDEIQKEAEIIGILDSNQKKWGMEINGYKVLGDARILEQSKYDRIIICALQFKEIKSYLLKQGVDSRKIITEYSRVYAESRELFVRDLGRLMKERMTEPFSVAEGGVYKGDFSIIINESFPKSPFYLFDTFGGFNEQDMDIDEKNGLSEAKINNRFTDTSANMVLSRLPHPEKAIICQGYFPDSTVNVPEQSFGFVNLDFDLYKPILDGLRYFYPRMIKGGIILIHDYFSETFNGVKKAVSDYDKEIGEQLITFPIGDHISMAIIKR